VKMIKSMRLILISSQCNRFHTRLFLINFKLLVDNCSVIAKQTIISNDQMTLPIDATTY
jgi:hypothetical protein